jgi:putative SOS response-associated peptidase YedK
VCTNFTPTKRAQWVKDKLGVHLPTGFPDESYPSFAAPLVVKSHQTGRVACGLARFGLIPSWAKDDKIGRYTYNARSETVAEKPSSSEFKTPSYWPRTLTLRQASFSSHPIRLDLAKVKQKSGSVLRFTN